MASSKDLAESGTCAQPRTPRRSLAPTSTLDPDLGPGHTPGMPEMLRYTQRHAPVVWTIVLGAIALPFLLYPFLFTPDRGAFISGWLNPLLSVTIIGILLLERRTASRRLEARLEDVGEELRTLRRDLYAAETRKILERLEESYEAIEQPWSKDLDAPKLERINRFASAAFEASLGVMEHRLLAEEIGTAWLPKNRALSDQVEGLEELARSCRLPPEVNGAGFRTMTLPSLEAFRRQVEQLEARDAQ